LLFHIHTGSAESEVKFSVMAGGASATGAQYYEEMEE
jgi:hypothetical protein